MGGLFGLRSGGRIDIFGGNDDLTIMLYCAIKSLMSLLVCWSVGDAHIISFSCTLGSATNEGVFLLGGCSALGTNANTGIFANDLLRCR